MKFQRFLYFRIVLFDQNVEDTISNQHSNKGVYRFKNTNHCTFLIEEQNGRRVFIATILFNTFFHAILLLNA